MSKDSDTFGDRMKSYEAPSTTRIAFKGLPIVARLDGKAFHTFTKGLARPYDTRLSNLMVEITKQLVDRFGADCGYTQSDEITLVWYVDSGSQQEYPFGGRLQKFESLLSSFAGAFINKVLVDYLPEKASSLPIFDCRAFVVPNLTEAVNEIVWRQQDCTKNAITMAAYAHYSHKECMNKNGSEKQEMLFAKGINFNDYPYFFKRGTFVRRVKELRTLSDEQLASIPAQHRPTGPVERSFIDIEDIWLTKQDDRIGVIFYGKPVVPA